MQERTDLPQTGKGAFDARACPEIRARNHYSAGPAREVGGARGARPRDGRDEGREARGLPVRGSGRRLGQVGDRAAEARLRVGSVRVPAREGNPGDGSRLRHHGRDEHAQEHGGQAARGRQEGRAVSSGGGDGSELQVRGGAHTERGVGGGPRPLPRALRHGAGDKSPEDAVLGDSAAPRVRVERAHAQGEP